MHTTMERKLCRLMAPLGALSQAWVNAEASLPLGWQISGLWRFDDVDRALRRSDRR
jgi:hypothetical protein